MSVGDISIFEIFKNPGIFEKKIPQKSHKSLKCFILLGINESQSIGCILTPEVDFFYTHNFLDPAWISMNRVVGPSVGGSVGLSVRPPLYLLNRLRYELEISYVGRGQ